MHSRNRRKHGNAAGEAWVPQVAFPRDPPSRSAKRACLGKGQSAELNREYSNKPAVQNVRSSAETPEGEKLIRLQVATFQDCPSERAFPRCLRVIDHGERRLAAIYSRVCARCNPEGQAS